MRILILYTFIMLVGLPSALARGVFAMDAASAEMYMPAVLNVLSGDVVAEAPGRNKEGVLKPYAIDLKTGIIYDCFVIRDYSIVYVGFENAPKGSVAVIPITDAIMKYDYCGAYGTVSYLRFLNDANLSVNIVGTVLAMDTPGGEVYGTKNVSDAVKNSPKPVIAHINDGYCASAGVYIAAPADKILLAQPTDKIGSVGVYSTLIDVRGAYEKQGYKIKTIYSPTSPEKNKAWNAAMEDDDIKPMQKDLQFLDKIFMEQVKQGRGSGLNAEVLDGGMFYAEEAIAMGLADGMATFEQAIEEVINLSYGSLTISG